MKTLLAAMIATLLCASPALAQLGGTGGPTRRDSPPTIRDVRDRPFGSMGTGSIMGSTGTDSAFGTGGSIGTGTGQGSGIGTDTGPGMYGGTGYRFSPNASPTNPAPLDVTGSTR